MVREVSFKSEGVVCAATYYRPDDVEGNLPCVVMGHGFTGTQELLEPYAREFVQAGLAVLTFDYRYFGKSDGQPRQLVILEQQMKDWRAAIAFARTLDGVDPERIAIWGSSLSGGYVINLAAEDTSLAAVIAQVPAIDKSTKGMSADANEKIARLGLTKPRLIGMYASVITMAIYDGVRGAFGLSPYYIPVFGKPGDIAAFTDPADYWAYDRFKTAAPTWENRFAPRFMFDVPKYRPGVAQRIQAPLLICAAEHDTEANPNIAAEVAKEAPHGEFKLYPGGHFEAYYGDTFERMTQDEVTFLRKHLLQA